MATCYADERQRTAVSNVIATIYCQLRYFITIFFYWALLRTHESLSQPSEIKVRFNTFTSQTLLHFTQYAHLLPYETSFLITNDMNRGNSSKTKQQNKVASLINNTIFKSLTTMNKPWKPQKAVNPSYISVLRLLPFGSNKVPNFCTSMKSEPFINLFVS